MAEPTPPTPASPGPPGPDPGAPFKPGELDPELIKLARPRLKIGIVTSAGLVVLCAVFLFRLGPDRRFAGADPTPRPVTAADVLAGKVDTEQLIAVAAEPVIAHAIRVATAPGRLGLRIAPARGTGDRLWIAVPGDAGQPPATADHAGRLRKLDALPFATAARAYAAAHPRPVFASVAAVRAGLAAGKVATVAGDQVAVTDATPVALDVVAPDTATIVASLQERLPDAATWLTALRAAGITAAGAAPATTPDTALGQARFTVPASVAATTAKLEAAGLWGARVEPVTRHEQTTWGALRGAQTAGAPGLHVGGQILPGDQLIGLHVARAIPDDAYVVVAGELPDDYWYVVPITVGLAVTLLVFAWALVRAIRRDLVATRT